MELALGLAAEAAEAGEVPVGAVLVKDGVVLGTGRNSPIQSSDPSAHAEINALRMAASALGNYRLEDCTLYVTLEPCAMCCGAVLHSRLQRLVFGAAEPRTGCAGSVLDLFAQERLNHHTAVQSGVLDQQAALQLQDFFRSRRAQRRDETSALRQDALRTSDTCFVQLAGYPWPANYVSELPSLAGLRLHYLDLHPTASGPVFLCLHPIPGWSFSLRAVICTLLEQGARVVVPDLIGFGKSDKPKRESFHSVDWHLGCLYELILMLDLQHITLVVSDASQPLVHGLTTDPRYRIEHLQVLACQSDERSTLGQDAPYPDAGHRAGERAFAPKRK